MIYELLVTRSLFFDKDFSHELELDIVAVDYIISHLMGNTFGDDTLTTLWNSVVFIYNIEFLIACKFFSLLVRSVRIVD